MGLPLNYRTRCAARNRRFSYSLRVRTEDGRLIAYGIDRVDPYKRAASYVDRILKGEKPSDLPMQQPTKFEFVINLRAAKAIGLDMPLMLQMTADEVIQLAGGSYAA